MTSHAPRECSLRQQSRESRAGLRSDWPQEGDGLRGRNGARIVGERVC